VSDEGQRMDPERLDQLVEALLFVAEGPIRAADLGKVLGVEEAEALAALLRLQVACANRGIRVQHERGRFQFVSAPEAAPYVEALLGLDLSTKLSVAALETLAIIAYRQPITRAEVSAIRGVDSDGVVRTLVARGLIGELGRLEQAGRPILYGTTDEFLQYFGLDDVTRLPALNGTEAAPDTPGSDAGKAG